MIRSATKIMLIRHAEKPLPLHHYYGVTPQGQQDTESLSVRGWQRAGALAALFAPANGIFSDARLTSPQFLFASKPTKHHGSRRPLETLIPLAEKLKLSINSEFTKGEPQQLADEALKCNGTVLISWYHENMTQVADRILGTQSALLWADHIYDMVWVFDQLPGSDRYIFTQVPQNLLAGDLA